MSCRAKMTFVVLAIGVTTVSADDVIHRYEGDVLPSDESAGWVVGRSCDPPCSEQIEDGCFVFKWPEPNHLAGYGLWISRPSESAPPTLWVEWQFRSNHPIGPLFFHCDAGFSIDYGGMADLVNMYGDAAVSIGADDFVLGLDINDFHTYRYESYDGILYTIAVDGGVFITDRDYQFDEYNSISFHGQGGCGSDWIPDMVNEWDFIRYGTLGTGELLVDSSPESGILNPLTQMKLDRFTVTFDSANYVYVDEILVETAEGIAPVVLRTRRQDNGEPDTVEIVLDRPIPLFGTTRITMNDGATINTIDYKFATGDANEDGDTDLFDYKNLIVCMTGPDNDNDRPACRESDLTLDNSIDLADAAAIQLMFSGSQ